MINIFIAEEIPCFNKGEAALMHGIIDTIRTYAGDDVTFYLCSRDRERDQNEYGEEVKVIQNDGMIARYLPKGLKQLKFSYNLMIHCFFLILYRLIGKATRCFFRGELWEAYVKADVIILGHDNSFTQYHFPLIIFSKWLGKKVCVYGATIMPEVFGSAFMKWFGLWAMEKADLVTTREERTYNMLNELGLNCVPLFCTADKAFILNPTPLKEIDFLRERVGIHEIKRPAIGIMVSKISTVYRATFKGQNLSPDEKYQKHALEIAGALDRVIEKTGGSVVFLGHCTGPGRDRDDRIVARSVFDKMTRKEQVCFVDDDLRAPELKALLGGFEFVVSERTHGGIGAASMMTPTLWITHPGDHRTHGIVGKTLELPQCIYNCEKLNRESLADKIEELYRDRQMIIQTLCIKVPQAQKLTMKNGEYFAKFCLA